MSKAATKPESPVNIVLITLDTTRADHIGAWGWQHAHTPNLDGLARSGVRFVRCDTVAPLTLPSHATMLTGLLPPGHGVRDNGLFVLAEEHTTLAEILAENGYDTAAVVAAVVLARGYGLAQGFRVYDDDLGTGYAAATRVVERDAANTTEAALRHLRQLAPPFFLWVHYFDPHAEYLPHPELGLVLSGPHPDYDAEIAFMDREIGRLLAALPPGCVVMAAGDHGEMLGDHGEAGHGILPFAGSRRVPLLLSGPGLARGCVVQTLVSLADVAPTLLELAGLPIRGRLDGTSLLRRLDSDHGSPAALTYSESFHPFFAFGWYPLRTLSDGELLYVHAPSPGLYRLDIEVQVPLPAEHDLHAWQQHLIRLLDTDGETLEPQLTPGRTPLPDEAAALEALGYVTSSSGGMKHATLADPRLVIGLASFLQDNAAAVAGGRCDSIMGVLQGLLKRDPHNAAAHILAGRCRLAAGNAVAAHGHFQQVAHTGSRPATALFHLAESLVALDRSAEAESHLSQVLRLDPVHHQAAALLARLQRKRGAAAAAVEVLDAVIAAGNHAPVLNFERALARAAARDLPGALTDFEEAARRDPANQEALDNAARIAERLGRFKDAARLTERLLRLRPSDGGRWHALGRIYLDGLQDPESALRCFRRALALETNPQRRLMLEDLLVRLGGG